MRYLLIWIGVFLSGAIVLFASSCNKNEHATTLHIVSPYNCNYYIKISDTRLQVESVSTSVSKVDFNKKDTIILKFDTLLSEEVQSNIHKEISSIKHKEQIVSKLVSTDSYQYELFVDGKLIRRSFCCDNEIMLVLRYCLPYIKRRKVSCCGFFDNIETINHSN
jgi:hypothetical protein